MKLRGLSPWLALGVIKQNWTPKIAQPKIPGILIDTHLILVLSE